ncbi:hypothetical protein [Azospirillum melinis]
MVRSFPARSPRRRRKVAKVTGAEKARSHRELILPPVAMQCPTPLKTADPGLPAPGDAAPDPRWVSRRPFVLSHAAMATSSV